MKFDKLFKYAGSAVLYFLNLAPIKNDTCINYFDRLSEVKLFSELVPLVTAYQHSMISNNNERIYFGYFI